MRRTRFPVHVLGICAGVALALGACAPGPASGAVPLAKALADPSLEAETRKFLESAAAIADYSAGRFGLEKGAGALRFVPGSRARLAWRVVTVSGDDPDGAKFSWHASADLAEAFADRAIAKGASALVEPVDSLIGSGEAAGPLLAAHASLRLSDLVEQINIRVFDAALRSGRYPSPEPLVLFLAEKATLLYLNEKLSPASPVVGEYIARKRDARVLQALLPGLRERFANVAAQDLSPEDRSASLAFQIDTWIKDFAFHYDQRFLTGTYRDFGSGPVDAALLASLADPVPRYEEWESTYRSLGENAVEFYRTVIGSR